MWTGHDARICHGRDHAFGEAERRPSTDSDLGFGLCLMMMVMCGRLCRVNRQNGYLICSLSLPGPSCEPPVPRLRCSARASGSNEERISVNRFR